MHEGRELLHKVHAHAHSASRKKELTARFADRELQDSKDMKSLPFHKFSLFSNMTSLLSCNDILIASASLRIQHEIICRQSVIERR